MRLSISVIVIGLLLGSIACAQSLPSPANTTPQNAAPQQAAPTVPSNAPQAHNLVRLIFTVTDVHGKLVKDLKQHQFKVLDNDRPPKEIVGFETQTDLPLRVGLLIDASNSIRDRFLFEQQAAAGFLHQVIRPQTDRAFVLAFDEVSEVIQGFTGDLDKLTAGIRNIRPGGGTAMWDAIYFACRDKMLTEKNSTPVRRVIIVVSDGEDKESRVLRQEAIEMAQRAEVIVYAISTNLSSIKDIGGHNLEMLAEATGGRAFFPNQLQGMSDAFNGIQGELRSQYSISYTPDGFLPNGQFRSIEITNLNKELRVRTAKGYFAPTR